MKISKRKLYPGGDLNQGPILSMLIPVCAQFHYAYGDPHMQTF